MATEHHVVYIPGLHDRSIFNRAVVRLLPFFWDRRGFPLHVVPPNWEEGDSFFPKLELILGKVDELLEEGKRVSVVGKSAGGSAALNVFSSRREHLTAAINATGRLRQGFNVGVKHVQTLDYASRNSPAFRSSVLLFERDFESTLTLSDRRRIMTVRPRWDQIVPPGSLYLKEATNMVSPMPEHNLGGVYIMTFYSKMLQRFLRSRER